MLHRMALRVLPSLSLAVTEEAVRKQKRIVMFVPGLVAFGVVSPRQASRSDCRSPGLIDGQ